MDDVYSHSVLAIVDPQIQMVSGFASENSHTHVNGSETPQRQLVSYILVLEHPLVAKAWV